MRSRLRLHPTGLILHRYAERTLAATPSLWVRRHLESCHTCRASVSFTRSLHQALASLPDTIELDDTLLDRIVEARAAGERTVLPAVDPARGHHSWSNGLVRGLGGVAAALVVAALVYRGRSPTTSESRATASHTSPATTAEFAVSEFFLPRSAFATETVRGNASSPRLTLDGTRLRAGIIKHARFERTAGGVRRQTGTESVEISPAEIEGRDAWRVVQRRQIADTEHVETLYAERATLRILGRTIRVHPYMHYVGITVRQRLVGDSLTGWMQTDSGLGRPIARRLPAAAAPYLSDALSPVLLGGTALGAGWQGSFSILGWAVRDGDVSFPVQLRVVGEERVTVPAGRFDCWKVAVEASVGMQTYWVRKSDGVGVRAVIERDGAVRELVLTR